MLQKRVWEMEWVIYSDAEAFAEEVEPLLYKEEDKYSLFLGVLGQIQTGRYEEYFLAVAKEEGEVAATCLMTPPHPLQLIVLKELLDIESEIAGRMLSESIEVTGIIGEKETVRKFAAAWVEGAGKEAAVLMDQGLYRIDAVNERLKKSSGSWRVANKNDAKLLGQWYLLFEKDTEIGMSTEEEASAKVERFIEEKEIYVWEIGGEAVSCMKKARPSRNGITVSFVFTPKEHRCKGFARTLVAEVTDELLLEYDFVMLYTDLKNPASNKIYSEIGYEKIANPVHIGFKAQ